MITDKKFKHFMHCMLLLIFVIGLTLFLTSITNIKFGLNEKYFDFNPWESYGTLGSSILYAFRLLVILALPQVILNFLGLTCFNAFPGNVILRGSSLLTPLICVRIVTRGDFPKLVRDNVARNMNKCLEGGMDNFLIEVVTDKPIGLQSHRRIREIIVPLSYTPGSGAKYKARALQYCLEDDVNILAENDYIVHLDEETIMTTNSVRGIINFVLDGKYDFGQGLITYANDQVVNWITTLADSNRVADDMGKLRAQFYFFHKPILSWKGSFIVAKANAEKHVSFNNGIRGSLAEDCYFAMKAYEKGYKFNFIDGEMWEKSPFTVWDFIEQRKRWLQGVALVVHAPEISWKYKMWLFISLYAWITMPLSFSNIIMNFFFPLPIPFWLNFLCSFVTAVNMYMYVFGTIKSFSIYRVGLFKYCLCLIAVVFNVILSILMENVAVLLAVFSEKKKFYIVKKDFALKKDTNIVLV